MNKSIWKSRVNSWLGVVFVGSVAVGASLIIWHTAFGVNPVANAMSRYMITQTQLP